jgi:hypothetical protein
MAYKSQEQIWGRSHTPRCTAINESETILVEETHSSPAILTKSGNNDDLTGISRCVDCFLYRTR